MATVTSGPGTKIRYSSNLRWIYEFRSGFRCHLPASGTHALVIVVCTALRFGPDRARYGFPEMTIRFRSQKIFIKDCCRNQDIILDSGWTIRRYEAPGEWSRN